MSSSLARLTMYSLISSFEVDMRNLIQTYCPSQNNLSIPLSADLYARLVERAKLEVGDVNNPVNLDSIIDYLDFGDCISLIRRNASSFPAEVIHQVKDFQSELDHLIQIRNRVMHSRPLEFDDLAVTVDLVERLVVNTQNWPALVANVEHLKTNPESVLGLQIPIQLDVSRCSNNLPIPDFDETGFIGRKDNLSSLLRACKGAYPVITLVGEGGLGKTSLALKAAYEILDSEDNPYDSIVFVSAKTSQLTLNEVRRIEGAINTSIGLMQAAVQEVSGSTDDPLQDLVTLMHEFKILLIVDNLETVIDDNINKLLKNLTGNSKVIITTRIGIGAYEYPIKLEPLSDAEAVQLLRATAKSRGVAKLFQLDNAKLAKFCSRMRNSPLHIKWFVSAIQAGRRPEEVLADEKVFLQFCLSNVYEQLSAESRHLVRVLLSVGGALTAAELAYVGEISEDVLLRSIQELLRTNIFIMGSSPTHGTFETRYELSALARSYLARFYPVNKEEHQRLIGIKKRLITAGEQIASEVVRNPLSPFTIHCRSRSDWVVAKYLHDALRESRAGNVDQALALIARAKSIAPDFFEIYRVEAWVHAISGNITQAFDAYELALDVNPNAANVHLFFGGFLLNELQDTKAAILHTRRACELLPEEPAPKTELVRCHLYAGEFEEAEAILEELSKEANLHERVLRKVHDFRLQLHQRWAFSNASCQQPEHALEQLQALKSYFQSIPYADDRMKSRVFNTRYSVRLLGPVFSGHPRLAGDLKEFTDWVGSLGAPTVVEDANEEFEFFEQGMFLRIHSSGRFGFLRRSAGEELFFHASSLNGVAMDSLVYGDRLQFRLSVDALGRFAAIQISRL